MKATIIILLIFSIISVLITGFWNDVTQVIFPNSSWGLYNRNFFENLLVEVHGTIIDLLVVSVILYWFDQRRTERDNITKAKDRLAHLKYYRGSDAAIKVYAALKYLITLNINQVYMPESDLSKLNIDRLVLFSSNLIATNFSNSHLKLVEFNKCDLEASQFIDSTFKNVKLNHVNLKRSKVINSQLKGMDFRTCDIRGASFKNASLESANFRGVDCSQVDFKGANLLSANFKEAKNLTREMILEANNYNYIKLPNEVTI